MQSSGTSGPGYLFVYGLLMRGHRHHKLLADGEFFGIATTRGQLVALGEYPGLLDGNGVVQGELYYFEDIAAALHAVDPVEGYNEADPRASMYLRQERQVECSAKVPRTVLAYVYVYNGSAKSAPPVPNGDWRAFAAAAGSTPTL